MPTVRKLSISLPEDLTTMMSEVVKAGGYSSTSEVVREALRDWQYKQQMRAQGLSALQNAYNAGMASGEGRAVSAQNLLAELKAKARTGG